MNTHENSRHQITHGDDQLAKGLGWFSIGLGLAAILAPRALAHLIGVRPHPLLFGALGARELLSGIGILSQRRPAPWLWSRVIGDVMDLSLLGTAWTMRGSDERRGEAATAAVLAVTALDVVAALRHSKTGQPIHVSRTIAIDVRPEDLYTFWHDFENLPRFMRHLESVRVTGENRSHWVARGPAGTTVEWDAETTQDIPGELIAWRSLPGAEVENAGSVRFETAPGDRGTFLRVELRYDPPGGIFGAAVAKLFGEAPEHQVQSDLYRLKQLIETGQVTTTEGQPAGRGSSTSPLFDSEHTQG